MRAVPLPPPIPLSGAMEIPVPTLAPPTIKPFEWEPVPIYVETVPPKPGTSGGSDSSKPTEEAPAEQPPVTETTPDPATVAPELPELPEEILAEVQTIEIPFTEIEVPVPRGEILVTAATTAGVSSVVAVSGTLFATTLFKQLQPILKPIFKFAIKKIAAIRKKPPPVTWARLQLKARGSHQHIRSQKGYVGRF